jgi:hypothetical protein
MKRFCGTADTFESRDGQKGSQMLKLQVGHIAPRCYARTLDQDILSAKRRANALADRI